ncbi:hypothetical protein BAC2_00560 [uncultured bacterium]|nr:hypothetical protein BAC2_00560 [uncultured bacterium]
MPTSKKVKKSKVPIPAVQLVEYFAGRHRPAPRDQIPITFQTLFVSIDAAKEAMLAPFPDLTEWPTSEEEAREKIEACAKWTASVARAFNDDPNSSEPFGLQTHFHWELGRRWARDYLGSLPADVGFQVKLEPYKQYLEHCNGEQEYIAEYRGDLVGNWGSVSPAVYWQYRSDRSACRRVLEWVTHSLDEFIEEETPRISYVKPLGKRLHRICVMLCGIPKLIDIQDNLVLLLKKLATGNPVNFVHRVFKRRLIVKIRSLANYILPAEVQAGNSAEVTGARYQLSRELVGRIDLNGYA